jgi:hydrogenase maturation factor
MEIGISTPVVSDTEGSALSDGRYCITCSDQAQEVSVLSVDQGAALALVALGDSTAQVDISLLDGVATGDRLLVHGGVALERLAQF